MITKMVSAFDVKLNAQLLSVVSLDTTLKKVASTQGGEWAGPCPFCGGEDRFRYQEAAAWGKKPTGERWMCRRCSPKWGDVIGYVQKLNNVDFQSALELLADMFAINHRDTPHPQKKTEIDRAQWLSAARVFIEECVHRLWSAEGAKALAYLHRRGLDDFILRQNLIGFCPKAGSGDPEVWGLPYDEKIYIPRGIVIPCHDKAGLHYIKVRQSQGEPRYLIMKGGEMWIYGLNTFEDAAQAFLFESELDSLLAFSSGLIGLGHGSLPAGQNIREEYLPFLESIDEVIVAYDNDEPGQKSAAKLCKLPGFRQAAPYPAGKDLTEYYWQCGSLDDVCRWLCGQAGI
jgi:DNA primase